MSQKQGDNLLLVAYSSEDGIVLEPFTKGIDFSVYDLEKPQMLSFTMLYVS